MSKEENERITYEEFMTMFKFAPRICYILYDKAEDEITRLTNNWRLLEEVIKDMLFTTPHEDQMLNFILGKMKEIEEKNK